MAKIKAIKPKDFKSDAVRLEILNALRLAGTQIKADFAKTTSSWKNKPKFGVKVSLKGGSPTVEVSTSDQVYAWVDEGTRAHPIVPVKAKRLRFKTGYNAKTQPGVLDARSGGADGDTVFARVVYHPGTEPREFSKLIKEKWEVEINEYMQEAMRRAAQKSGHAR